MPENLIHTIKILPQSVISYIAAGEVIERPASALKELIENSIDSNATHIKVNVVNQGLTTISVVDDGEGIPKDQLAIAVKTHTTSKVANISDLESIQTLGFRGEALGSIASLSNLTICSRPKEQSDGAKITLQGPYNNEQPQPHVMAPGTKVTINGLFQHAPARLKFVQKSKSELAKLLSSFKQLALTAPHVEMEFNHDDHLVNRYPVVENINERIFEILGKSFKEEATYIFKELGSLKIQGFMNFEGYGTKLNQYIFINNRFVIDKLIIHAIRRALSEEMRKSNVPYVLYLELPFNLYDVNAHPSKQEIRFKEDRAIFKFILDAIVNAIETPIGKNPNIVLNNKVSKRLIELSSNHIPKSSQEELDIANELRALSNLNKNTVINEEVPPNALNYETIDDPQELVSLGKPIGMIHGIYLMAEHEEGIIIIDIHAAHERILYEELKDNIHNNTTHAQKLLEPIPLLFDAVELDAIENNRQELSKVGLTINNHDGVEQLETIPNILAGRDIDYIRLVAMCISELIDTGMVFSVESKINFILSSMACHSAVRGANPFITTLGQQELIAKMKTTIRSGKCNHGRPCWKLISVNELDKQFERGR